MIYPKNPEKYRNKQYMIIVCCCNEEKTEGDVELLKKNKKDKQTKT